LGRRARADTGRRARADMWHPARERRIP